MEGQISVQCHQTISITAYIMFSDTSPSSESSLLRMVAHTQRMVEQRKKEVPLAGMRALAGMQRRTIDLSSTLRERDHVALIVQIKRADPNNQIPLENYQPLLLAKQMEALGATALAVSTNEKFYHGGIADLTRVAQTSKIPVIRHDFVYDEYQIVEARAAGADGVLLIAALLAPKVLRNLISITQRNRMTAVVQVQNSDELEDTIAFEPRVIAISNRDMHSFTLDLDNTRRLRDLVPPHMTVISIGGIYTPKDVAYIQQTQLHGMMVGQQLLTASEHLPIMQTLFELSLPT